jgi:hypothetical protein
MLSKSYTRVRVRACVRVCVCTYVCTHIYIYIYNYSLYTLRICTVVEARSLVVVPIVYLRHSIWIVIIISTRVLQGVVKIQSSGVVYVRLKRRLQFYGS